MITKEFNCFLNIETNYNLRERFKYKCRLARTDMKETLNQFMSQVVGSEFEIKKSDGNVNITPGSPANEHNS